ncbi:MAG: ABC transporter permease [Desulfarculaceae bacterium]|nr:ABC transporter permease [Desulfarculaceae bacterium]MCF8071391.1 ABC transporter permease [Desulfarculaceae bacterium]MCF8101716.1 ABC transporter permease [Desulfarculaceae bacterium]MCF8118192.1 ABC transporter permease [Desulfarculaceae bacterium]
MRAFLAIYKRELTAYFHSPVAYVVLVCFLAISGYFFYAGVSFYSLASLQVMQNPMMMELNLQTHLIAQMVSSAAVILLFGTPLLTMRLLAEEKKSGTIELLLSYPLGDASVVMGKFFAAWTVSAILVAATWLQLALLAPMTEMPWRTIMVSYGGLLLLCGAMVSFSLWTSSLTESQLVAAFLGFLALLLLWAVGWAAPLVQPSLGELLKGLSLGSHFQNFPKGLVDTTDLAYFVLFMGLFLFLSIRTLEAKRWKA